VCRRGEAAGSGTARRGTARRGTARRGTARRRQRGEGSAEKGRCGEAARRGARRWRPGEERRGGGGAEGRRRTRDGRAEDRGRGGDRCLRQDGERGMRTWPSTSRAPGRCGRCRGSSGQLSATDAGPDRDLDPEATVMTPRRRAHHRADARPAPAGSGCSSSGDAATAASHPVRSTSRPGFDSASTWPAARKVIGAAAASSERDVNTPTPSGWVRRAPGGAIADAAVGSTAARAGTCAVVTDPERVISRVPAPPRRLSSTTTGAPNGEYVPSRTGARGLSTVVYKLWSVRLPPFAGRSAAPVSVRTGGRAGRFAAPGSTTAARPPSRPPPGPGRRRGRSRPPRSAPMAR
jgi:hypothetical protein